MDHYAAQDKPLFELTEGEGERASVTPLFSIPEILGGVKTVGKKGIQMYSLQGSWAKWMPRSFSKPP